VLVFVFVLVLVLVLGLRTEHTIRMDQTDED
jgi:hypothetical protein